MSVEKFDPNERGNIVRCGLLKKLKTSCKKWFVLRAETADTSPRLEYYDSKRKFKNGLPPKRSIPLRTCFNINKRRDTKYKHVIGLYTKDDCFGIVLQTEEELEAWLKDLLFLQHGEEIADGAPLKPTFGKDTDSKITPSLFTEHVWQVKVVNRGLGSKRLGWYRLCLKGRTVTMIKKNETEPIEFPLGNIRSCGTLNNYFFLEVGRSSELGAGEIWMVAEDGQICENIKQTIETATRRKRKKDLEPQSRTRSSSATESSKPNATVNSVRQETSEAPKVHVFSKDALGIRDRCDSMPSRPRTASEGTHPLPPWRLITSHHLAHLRDVSQGPSVGSPISPPSAAGSINSTGSSFSIVEDVEICTECSEPMRFGNPLTPDQAIAEEECQEGSSGVYVPMAPPSEGRYVDMSPRCSHSVASPTTSMGSVTSGTPSTDIRFSDYPLDKVMSYFTAEEDDSRPARAYSVGSRPEMCRNKRHMELAGTPENYRVRAFSVGSRTKKGPTRVLPPHYPHTGAKCSSAPLLSSVRSNSSHSSLGPMDDLMEMDFSRSNTGSSSNSGYMEMKPGIAKKRSGYVEMKPGVALNKANASDEAYVDMSPLSPARNHVKSPQEEYNSFVDMRQYHRLSSHEQVRNNNYMDMDMRKRRTQSSSARVSTSPSSYSYPWSNFIDMSSNQPKRSERGSFSSQLSSSPNVLSESPKEGDYMTLGFSSQDSSKVVENQPKTPEGYVEMTPGSVKHQRMWSLDSSQDNKGNEDYTNMSLGLGQSKKKPTKKEKTCSQPISINPATVNSQVTKSSSSPISVSSLLGRKSSTGTPPRMHLPISSWGGSPHSSLPRQRTRKDSNTNSKDSSSSSITTPSSSSTIFPLSLNSPSSPMKPAGKAQTPSALKIPAAVLNAVYKATNKFAGAQPSTDDYAVMDFEFKKNKPAKADSGDYVNYAPATKTLSMTPSKVEAMDETPGDYAIMKPGVIGNRPIKLFHQGRISLGNTSPLENHLSSIGISESQAMVFRPIKEETKLGGSSPRPGDVPAKLNEDPRTTATAITEGVDSSYVSWRSSECVSPAAKISRPNSVNSDGVGGASPRSMHVVGDRSRPSSVASESSKMGVSRAGSSSSELYSSSSTIVGSRPESVNSESARPDSAAVKTDVQLHYASLDLAQPDEDGSRSPRTAKGNPGDSAAQGQSEPAFFYAKIDFKKSEVLKQSNQNLQNNAKVQH